MKASNIGCISCLVIIGLLCILYFTSSSKTDYNQTSFEVVTNKGTVRLHLGMPKDSVIMLIGKPDDIESHSEGKVIIEEIGYKVNSDDYPDLNFSFENGKLESFSQR